MRCFDFCRCEMFHSTRSLSFSICQNFSKVSAFSPKTYLCILFTFLKRKKIKAGWGGEKYPFSPQEVEL